MKQHLTQNRLLQRFRLQSPSGKRSVRIFSMAAGLLALGITASAQITISGTVYDDGDGLVNNGIINGTAISTVNGTQLYVYLIANNNSVVASSAVTGGAYSLSGTANTNYSVGLSSIAYSNGALFPAITLPSNYFSIGEGTTPQGDGSPDLYVAINSATNLTINFGIDARPAGNTYNLVNPAKDANGRAIIPAAAFTGSDPEDGLYSAGYFGRDIDLFQGSGGNLYYNGNLITFSSANASTRISNFDVSKLSFQPISGSHQFAFATVDNAGIPESVPNTITVSIVLPVTLTSFTGTAKGADNFLQWQTASEVNNAGFEVERSTDGVTFSMISSIASQAKNGTSADAKNYSYLDVAPVYSSGNALYYRLKQIDLDGSFTYSNTIRIISVNTGNTGNTGIQLSTFPNPSTGNVSLDIATGSLTDETVTIIVLNATGKPVISRNLTTQSGRISTTLDLGGLPAGTYYVRSNSNTSSQSQKIILLPH